MSSASGHILFGKNSDRQRNEAQVIELVPALTHAAGSTVACTYLSIPQVPHTHAVLLCRPFWIWGAEMGANEHGVVIGNEGLHARVGPPRGSALTGMDLIRLALERASTAEQALHVITNLLEMHGQGGNCGHLEPALYHNGFLIADANEAFILEAIEREWLVERAGNLRTLSNRYSIQAPEKVSRGLGVLLGDAVVHSHADQLADPGQEHIGNAEARRARSMTLLANKAGGLSVMDMMGVLRDHGHEQESGEWSADCAFRRTICMHAGTDKRSGQTVGSMVSELAPNACVHWVTGTAAPCISIFKPILLNADPPAIGPVPTDRFDERTLWWRHERLHRTALAGNFAAFLRGIQPERDALEARFVERMGQAVSGGDEQDRSHIVAECWQQAAAAEARWLRHLPLVNDVGSQDAVRGAWRRMNALAQLEIDP
jgi:secernin